MDSLWGPILRLSIFLPLVALLAYISIKYGLSKMQQTAATSRMQIIDQLSLGPKSGLFVVKVAEQYLLIAINGEQTQVLKDLPGYPELESTELSETRLVKVVSQIQDFWTSKLNQRGKKS